MAITRRAIATAAAVMLALAGAHLAAQGSAEADKLGMFRQGERTFVGMVLKDAIVLELAKAGVTATGGQVHAQRQGDAGLEHRSDDDTVFEMVEFASRVLTLRAGDVLAMGSPAGVGTARATPIYFKDGDTSVCTIERIGTLSNPIRAER